MLRSQWSHYGIEYQVPPYWYLNGSWRDFEGYNICLKTDPVAHGEGYIYIELIKDGFWSNPSQGTKKIKLNNGFQTVRWHGVGAGSYKLHIGNPDNNLRVSDLEAEIYDC